MTQNPETMDGLYNLLKQAEQAAGGLHLGMTRHLIATAILSITEQGHIPAPSQLRRFPRTQSVTTMECMGDAR